LQTLPRRLYIAAQALAAALLLYYVGTAFADRWDEFRAQQLDVVPAWDSIIVSAGIVLVTYALLVQVWRILMAGGGVSLRFWRAAHIWSVSNLWRYVPGKVWSIGAMSALAHRENVPAATAAGASILGVVLNIATGVAISMLLAWRWLGGLGEGTQAAGIAALVAAVVGLVSLPYALPRLAALASRVLGRDVTLQPPPAWALGVAVAGNMVSWALYGLAFSWFAKGLIGAAAGGATWQYVAVFTASYVVGYLFLFAPGGIGPREVAMYELLTAFGLATTKEATLITVASRVWLSILEIVPGLLFMLFGRRRTPSDSNALPPDVPRQ
jgi:uncharacterized membrane protein YbhN (UPF0104 family)